MTDKREEKMSSAKFDAIIIGTGQAGPGLARRFSKEGRSLAIIEENHFGGSCVNYGCTPTKTYVADAKMIHSAKKVKGDFPIDFQKIKQRKDDIVHSFTTGLEKSLKSLEHTKVYEGKARFVSPHQVAVGDQILEGDKIFINTGAKAFIPPKLSGIPYLTNISLLNLNALPTHLLILGGGYIATEFAQIYSRFGSKVTLIERSPLIMHREDPDISEAIEKILRDEGIDIFTNIQNFEVLSGSKEGAIEVQFDQQRITGSHLLIATGRVPNTDGLSLENAQVKTDRHGYIEVNDQLQTSQPHIWALGDVNGKGAFTHTSYNDYEIVAENLFDHGFRKVSDRIPIYALFTDPPLGRVGLNEAEAREAYPELLSASLPMKDVSRAIEKGETEGLMKILVDGKTKLIVGASFLGTDCDEVVQIISLAMTAKLPYTAIQKTVFIHPTVAEYLPTLLSRLEIVPNL